MVFFRRLWCSNGMVDFADGPNRLIMKPTLIWSVETSSGQRLITKIVMFQDGQRIHPIFRNSDWTGLDWIGLGAFIGAIDWFWCNCKASLFVWT